MMEREVDERGNEILYLEKLDSLKELKCQQRLLSRCEWRLEQTFSEHSECCETSERCSTELERLRREREMLVQRLYEIDSDIERLSDLSSQLSCEASLRAISAPLDDYARTLEHVNSTRHTLGMSPLTNCHAYSQLTQLHQSVQVVGSESMILLGKAGKAHKSCPHCYKLVSRNAVTCPGCSAPCSKKRSSISLKIMDYLWPCLIFVWSAYIWETYLQWRQRRVYQISSTVPSELEQVIDQATFDKSREYQLDKSTFSLFHGFFKQIEFLGILALSVLPLGWDAAGDVIEYFGYDTTHEVKQTVVFLLMILTYSAMIELPWDVYMTFVLEERHGFNKQTPWFFIKDQVKGFLLQCVLVPLITGGLIFVIKWGGAYFYIYAWLFVLFVSLVMIFVYHDYIAPLFDKYTPLPDGELKTAIEKLAASLQFPLKKLLVVEGSKRSAHSNAYFYGFWKNKRIVLFDTLLEEGIMPAKEKAATSSTEESSTEDKQQSGADGGNGNKVENYQQWNESKGEKMEGKGNDQKADLGSTKEDDQLPLASEGEGENVKKKKKGCSKDEILAVLAHELGHWKCSHNLINLTIGEINLLLSLFMFGFFMNQSDLYTSFGFLNAQPVLIGLILFFQLIYIPYAEVFSFLVIQLVRRFEYQADGFAKSLGYKDYLSTALTKLHKDNLSFPIADRVFSAFHHSHPTLLERLRALSDKKEQ